MNKIEWILMICLLCARPSSPQPLPLQRSRGFNHSEGPPSPPQSLYAEGKAWGANVIRMLISDACIPVPFWDNWPGFLDELDRRVGRADSAGVKVIVTPKFSPFDENRDYDIHPFWVRPDLVSSFIRVWTDIAVRLKKYGPTVFAYDLFNEPLDWFMIPLAPPEWRNLSVKLVEAIRKVDEDVWIMYEPGPGGVTWAFAGLTPLPDRKIIYSPHLYQPQDFTHQGVTGNPVGIPYPGNGWDKARIEKELDAVRRFQLLYDVPILVGEFSVSSFAPLADAQQWYNDVLGLYESYNWSWLYHGWRDADFWSMELADPSLVEIVQGSMRLNEASPPDTFNTLLEAPGHYEAEYAAEPGAAAAANEHYEFTGGGYAVLTGAESYCRWETVRTAVSGGYELNFAFSNAYGSASTAGIAVNGIPVGSLTFPVTGGGNHWRIARIKTNLNEGLNTVQVTVSSGQIDLDNLIVTRESPSPLLEHDFRSDRDGHTGWTVAGGTSAEEPDGVRITAAGYDGKIYHTLAMNRGTYQLTAQVRGATLVKIQDSGFLTTFYERKMQSLDAARHFSEPVTIPEDGDKRLIIQVDGGSGKESAAFMIRVDSLEALPDVSPVISGDEVFVYAPEGILYGHRGRGIVLAAGLPENVMYRAVIYRSTGERTAEISGNSHGRLVWNQRDFSGAPVPFGMYFYRIIENGQQCEGIVGGRIMLQGP